jgi:hypothetical protein
LLLGCHSSRPLATLQGQAAEGRPGPDRLAASVVARRRDY